MAHQIKFILHLLVGLILSTILVACGASTPTAEIPTPSAPKQWDTPPEMTIDTEAIYLATLVTEKGEIKIELFASKAPRTVNNFIFLAREGYYDGTTFHRVLSDFMAQGGDPTGTGGGGPGYNFEDEFHPDLRFDGAGYFAMANGGPNTNGSQFFITFGSTEYLTGRHTIFGKVVEGMDVVLSLTLRDPQENPDYQGDLLQTVEIEEIPESLLPPPTATPIPVVPQLEEGRPLASLEISDREGLYTGKPDMVIDPAKLYAAIIETTKGEIEIELRPQFTPESVNNFFVLARLGYWDGFPIVYVEPDVLILTGSPLGRVDSDVGYTLPLELGMPNSEGAVGFLFRSDVNASSGSQFYILLQENLQLDGAFTVFGYVIDGLDVVRELTLEDKIERISIEEK
ncbi:MAG TPA: peptidylprolyl isomerase [Anaerolineae bacterium]|nr:peptidylprolyl isomerase [Anaerolineae bacterium]